VVAAHFPEAAKVLVWPESGRNRLTATTLANLIYCNPRKPEFDAETRGGGVQLRVSQNGNAKCLKWKPDNFSIDQRTWLFPKEEHVALGLALDTEGDATGVWESVGVNGL
jgi:hypothetical protein